MLYATHDEHRVYYCLNTDSYDTILLWKSTPLNISNNKAILDQYNIFEYEFRNWKDSLQNCSTTEIFTICFNGDTSSVMDMSCKFNSFAYLAQLIQDGVNLENTYSITSAQADSIFFGRCNQ